MPSLSTDHGALVALLLVESNNPFNPLKTGYNPADTQLGMQAMQATVYNRLKRPQVFGAAGATTISQIIGAPSQFKGFATAGSGVSITASLQKLLTKIYKTANTKGKLQAAFRAFIQMAESVASSPVNDPFASQGGTYGFRTVGHGSPGKNFVPIQNGAAGGNQFFTLKGVDLAFVIDTTGSMTDNIAAVMSEASTLIDKLAADSPNFRIGLELYKDNTPDSAYITQAALPFTNNAAAAQAAINAITVGGGGDIPEAVFSGLIAAIDNKDGIGPWRDGVSKRIIVMGDAGPHNPESWTGYTFASVKAAAAAGGVTLTKMLTSHFDRHLQPERFSPDASPSEPVDIFTVPIGTDPDVLSGFQEIAAENRGQEIPATDSTTLVSTLGSVIDSVAASSGPSISDVEPLTLHRRVTGVTLSFDSALNAASATQLANYEVNLTGHGKHSTTGQGPVVRLLSSSYNPTTNVVTLSFKRLPRSASGLIVQVSGTPPSGVTDAQGNLLFGGDFSTTVALPTHR
jgi:hypothetical protein